MSNLLSQASLVMIPSGYKEDVVYSPIPTNGNGDLSFTRASNGTRVNSAGLVEVVPWNLVTYSEEFNIGVWTIAQISVSANTTTAPNGTTTADTITTSSTGVCYIYQGFSLIGGVFTLSVYAKKGNNDFIAINNQSTSTNWVTAVFDLTDGTFGEYAVGSGGGFTYISNNIESVGNGWYRCSLVFSGVTNNTTYPSIMFAPSKTGNTFTSSYGETSGNASGKTLFIWGAQLNIGSTAKPYFPTTDRLNVPRLTYQNGGGGCPSLLLEKQSTNLCVESNVFNTSPWVSGSQSGTNPVITPNYGISPDGTQNAVRIELARQNVITSYSQIYQYPIAITSGQPYTWSVYLKSLSGTPTISIIGDFGRPPVTLTSEWVRYTGTYTAGASQTQLELAILGSNYATGNSLSADFLAYGYQIEQSSYPTSYIPTTSSSATRVADDCSKTGISSLIGGGVGTWFMDFEMIQTTGSGNPFAFDLSDGSTANRLFLYWGESTQSWNWGGADTAITLPSTLRKKVAVKYSSGTGKLFCNGSLISTLSLNTAWDRLDIGQRFSNQYPMDGKINQAYFLTTSLTDAECQAITTI